MRALPLLTVLFLGLAACGGKSTPPAAPASTTEPAATAGGDVPACAEGELAIDDACVKECGTDADCAEGEMCEQLRSMNEDGTIGPVLGSGCTK